MLDLHGSGIRIGIKQVSFEFRLPDDRSRFFINAQRVEIAAQRNIDELGDAGCRAVHGMAVSRAGIVILAGNKAVNVIHFVGAAVTAEDIAVGLLLLRHPSQQAGGCDVGDEAGQHLNLLLLAALRNLEIPGRHGVVGLQDVLSIACHLRAVEIRLGGKDAFVIVHTRLQEHDQLVLDPGLTAVRIRQNEVAGDRVVVAVNASVEVGVQIQRRPLNAGGHHAVHLGIVALVVPESQLRGRQVRLPQPDGGVAVIGHAVEQDLVRRRQAEVDPLEVLQSHGVQHRGGVGLRGQFQIPGLNISEAVRLRVADGRVAIGDLRVALEGRHHVRDLVLVNIRHDVAVLIQLPGHRGSNVHGDGLLSGHDQAERIVCLKVVHRHAVPGQLHVVGRHVVAGGLRGDIDRHDLTGFCVLQKQRVGETAVRGRREVGCRVGDLHLDGTSHIGPIAQCAALRDGDPGLDVLIGSGRLAEHHSAVGGVSVVGGVDPQVEAAFEGAPLKLQAAVLGLHVADGVLHVAAVDGVFSELQLPRVAAGAVHHECILQIILGFIGVCSAAPNGATARKFGIGTAVYQHVALAVHDPRIGVGAGVLARVILPAALEIDGAVDVFEHLVHVVIDVHVERTVVISLHVLVQVVDIIVPRPVTARKAQPVGIVIGTGLAALFDGDRTGFLFLLLAGDGVAGAGRGDGIALPDLAADVDGGIIVEHRGQVGLHRGVGVVQGDSGLGFRQLADAAAVALEIGQRQREVHHLLRGDLVIDQLHGDRQLLNAGIKRQRPLCRNIILARLGGAVGGGVVHAQHVLGAAGPAHGDLRRAVGLIRGHFRHSKADLTGLGLLVVDGMDGHGAGGVQDLAALVVDHLQGGKLVRFRLLIVHDGHVQLLHPLVLGEGHDEEIAAVGVLLLHGQGQVGRLLPEDLRGRGVVDQRHRLRDGFGLGLRIRGHFRLRIGGHFRLRVGGHFGLRVGGHFRFRIGGHFGLGVLFHYFIQRLRGIRPAVLHIDAAEVQARQVRRRHHEGLLRRALDVVPFAAVQDIPLPVYRVAAGERQGDVAVGIRLAGNDADRLIRHNRIGRLAYRLVGRGRLVLFHVNDNIIAADCMNVIGGHVFIGINNRRIFEHHTRPAGGPAQTIDLDDALFAAFRQLNVAVVEGKCAIGVQRFPVLAWGDGLSIRRLDGQVVIAFSQISICLRRQQADGQADAQQEADRLLKPFSVHKNFLLRFTRLIQFRSFSSKSAGELIDLVLRHLVGKAHAIDPADGPSIRGHRLPDCFIPQCAKARALQSGTHIQQRGAAVTPFHPQNIAPVCRH